MSQCYMSKYISIYIYICIHIYLQGTFRMPASVCFLGSSCLWLRDQPVTGLSMSTQHSVVCIG